MAGRKFEKSVRESIKVGAWGLGFGSLTVFHIGASTDVSQGHSRPECPVEKNLRNPTVSSPQRFPRLSCHVPGSPPQWKLTHCSRPPQSLSCAAGPLSFSSARHSWPQDDFGPRAGVRSLRCEGDAFSTGKHLSASRLSGASPYYSSTGAGANRHHGRRFCNSDEPARGRWGASIYGSSSIYGGACRERGGMALSKIDPKLQRVRRPDTPHAPRPTPHSLNPPHPKPCAANLETQSRHPTPQSLNPTPPSVNPTPQALCRKA